MNYIKSMWPYANIAYQEPKGDEALFWDAQKFYPMMTDIDFAYWAEFPDKIIVGFRGTDTRDKGIRGIKTWLSNMDAYPLRAAEMAVKRGRSAPEVIRDAGLVRDGVWGKGTIHDGFYTMWKRFKGRIDNIIADAGNDKVLIATAHSRGGPCAELLCRHLVKNRGWSHERVQCLTFGAPAAGTKDYREEFRNLGIRAINVVNGYDIVPDCPPRILGFRHGAYRKWLSQPWWHRILHRIRDHLPENYTKRIYQLS